MKKQTTDYYGNNREEVAILLPLEIKSILDIGCGQGAFLKLIKDKTGAETWGVEMMPTLSETAKKNVDNLLIGKIEDLLDLIPNNYFDCITFNDVLEHVLEPTEVLRLIKPKLRIDGVIIASIPNVRYISNLYELLIKKDWEYKDSGILDSTHFRFFTQKSMKRMFENAGYKLLKQDGINATASWKFKFLNFISIGFFSDTKYTQFVCKASKK
jgi:2-polyprenyl-3-methyl-5-hydroxy-6-metoxy-1,4-benzoquinol methylase